MPRAGPIVKKGVFNRREKIAIDGLTATSGHHQQLKRQRMNEKFRDKAKAKHQTTGSAVAQNTSSNGNISQKLQPTHGKDGPAHHAAPGMYYDYKRGSVVELGDNEAQVAWAAAAAKVSGGRIKAKKENIEEGGSAQALGARLLLSTGQTPIAWTRR